MIANVRSASDHIQATRGDDYAFIYSAQGEPVQLNLGKISGSQLSAFWYNPRTGASEAIGVFLNKGQKIFTAPSVGYGQDWVLVIDDVLKKYVKP